MQKCGIVAEAAKMSSQVTPKDSCIISICDSPSSISTRTVTNEIALDERGQGNANANEEFLQAIAEIYKPVLRLLKLSGVYFGSTTFVTTIYPSNQGKGNVLSRFYCGIVAFGLWFDFLMPVVSVFCGADIYLNIMNLGWCLLVALLGTTCLIVLPSTSTKASRFENFIRKVSSTEIKIPSLAKVKSRSRMYLILFLLYAMVSLAGAFVTDLLLQLNIGNAWPWKKWPVFRITSLIVLSCSCGVWFFPIAFFCTTCLIIETLFDNFHKKTSLPHSANSLDIVYLRQQHHSLCQVVDFADRLFSPLLLEAVGFSIPVMCFNFYQLIHSQNVKDIAFVISVLFWLLSSATIIAAVLINGSRVNEKVKISLVPTVHTQIDGFFRLFFLYSI